MAKKTYGHPLRSTWYAMIRRCHHTNDARYKDYGARGIVVCDRWRNSFDSFASDMGTKPSPLHTLDRVNNDGNYEPSNCRWADKKTQNSNTRNTLMVTWDGKTQTMSQWARDLGISNGTLWNRLQNMTIEDAMTQSIDELSRVRKWTLSEIDTVLEMHESGKALRVIAEEVHASKECVKRLIWRLTPIPKTPAQPATATKEECLGCAKVARHPGEGYVCFMHYEPPAAPPSPAAREACCMDAGADGLHEAECPGYQTPVPAVISSNRDPEELEPDHGLGECEHVAYCDACLKTWAKMHAALEGK